MPTHRGPGHLLLADGRRLPVSYTIHTRRSRVAGEPADWASEAWIAAPRHGEELLAELFASDDATAILDDDRTHHQCEIKVWEPDQIPGTTRWTMTIERDLTMDLFPDE